mmetsp:Transcript_36582/g.118179  ORF Transcript_36582/g.118179 Transcript_36582/m.118179 type:complete len:209 (-) Transcript_36582:317-943(-)
MMDVGLNGYADPCHAEPQGLDSPRSASPEFQVLEEHIDSQEIDEASVFAYAAWLGINMDRDADLVWSARAAFVAPLPLPWRACEIEGKGEVFYFNFETGESIWEHPGDEYHRQLLAVESAKKYGLAMLIEPHPIPGGTHETTAQPACDHPSDENHRQVFADECAENYGLAELTESATTQHEYHRQESEKFVPLGDFCSLGGELIGLGD